MRARVVTTTATLLLCLGATLAAPAPAGAAGPSRSADAVSETSLARQAPAARKGTTKCVRGSGPSRGTCYKYLSSRFKLTPVESIPLRNRSSRVVTMSCGFSRTITKSITESASMSSAAEVNAVFGLAKVTVEASVSRSVSQTAEQATTAGGSIRLKPGQQVVCVRTYGSTTLRLQRYEYFPSGKVVRKNFRTKIPAYLGVDIRD